MHLAINFRTNKENPFGPWLKMRQLPKNLTGVKANIKGKWNLQFLQKEKRIKFQIKLALD